MFGHRTPAKKSTQVGNIESPKSVEMTEKAGPSSENLTGTVNVRRSVGDWESVNLEETPPTQNIVSKNSSATVTVAKDKPRKIFGTSPQLTQAKQKTKYNDRLSEARACVTKAKLHLGNSRNIKTEIKTEVTQAIERLYQLVKEAESSKSQLKAKTTAPETTNVDSDLSVDLCVKDTQKIKENELIESLHIHTKLIKETNQKMESLKQTLDEQRKSFEKESLDKIYNKLDNMKTNIIEDTKNQIIALNDKIERAIPQNITYAEMAARPKPPRVETVHSIIVTSEDEKETSGQVMEKIRTAVDATTSGIRIDKIRKAKDQKVVLGCHSKEEIQKVTNKIKEQPGLQVVEAKSKDPLIILKDVLQCHKDEDLIKAITNQNKHLLEEINKDEIRMQVKYRKRARNPLENHVVMQVSPQVWKNLTEFGKVHIDLQRIYVADQSPLVQCSLCLGYGHGRRLCKQTEEICSYCGGPHLWAECADRLVGEEPKCCNCTRAKMTSTNHQAFSKECPVRRKWDALARATIGYC